MWIGTFVPTKFVRRRAKLDADSVKREETSLMHGRAGNRNASVLGPAAKLTFACGDSDVASGDTCILICIVVRCLIECGKNGLLMDGRFMFK